MLVLGFLMVLFLRVLFLILVRNNKKIDNLHRYNGKGFDYGSDILRVRTYDCRFALPTAVVRLNVKIRRGTFFKKWQSPYRCSEFNLRC